jgi:hypothetical protein
VANVQLEQNLEISGSFDNFPAGVFNGDLSPRSATSTPGECGGVGLKYRKNGRLLLIAPSMNSSALTNVHSKL